MRLVVERVGELPAPTPPPCANRASAPPFTACAAVRRTVSRDYLDGIA
ncbi:MAG: hypothetical protein ACK6DT_02460 [Planctomycetota bacterium]